MAKLKVAVSIDRAAIDRVGRLVRQAVFPSRSRAVEIALEEKLAALDRGRLARECAKLDPKSEKAMAEEGLSGVLSGWPEY